MHADGPTRPAALPWPRRLPRRARRWRPRSRCRAAGRAPARRHAARIESAYRRARTARRRPWVRRTCGRPASADRRRVRRHSAAACRPTGRRPYAAGCRVRASMRAISRIGCTVPTSLFACITETSAVSGRSASASCVERDPTEPVDGQHRQRPSLIAQVKRRRHDGRMLDGADHQVALRRAERTRHAQQRQVVGLGRAAGEDDLLRPARRSVRPPDAVPRRRPAQRVGRKGARWTDCRTHRAATAASHRALPAPPGWWRCSRGRWDHSCLKPCWPRGFRSCARPRPHRTAGSAPATSHIAAASPNRSAVMPASSAPTA